jgi:hypothetical protein
MTLLSFHVIPDRVIALDPAGDCLIDMIPQSLPVIVGPYPSLLLGLHHVHDELGLLLIVLPLPLLHSVCLLQCELVLPNSVSGPVLIFPELLEPELHSIKFLLMLLEVFGHRKYMKAADICRVRLRRHAKIHVGLIVLAGGG